MQKLSKKSALNVYYDDLLYLTSSLAAAAEENAEVAPLAIRANEARELVVRLQQEERTRHEQVVRTRARGKFFDKLVDNEVLESGLTMEGVVRKDYKHPEYLHLYRQHRPHQLIDLGITRENKEMRLLLKRAEDFPETHPFRVKHVASLAAKLEKSEKADAEYKQAQSDEQGLYARAMLSKDKLNKERREIYVELQRIYPHDKEIVEAFFQPTDASAPSQEEPEETPAATDVAQTPEKV